MQNQKRFNPSAIVANQNLQSRLMTSDDVREALEEMERMGYDILRTYRPAEVWRIAKDAADSRDRLWVDTLNNELIPVFGYSAELQELISEILGYVRRTPGKLWTDDEQTKHRYYPFSEIDAGNILKLYGQLIIVLEGIGVTISASGAPDRVNIALKVADAIRTLINDNNDKPLRVLAADYVNLSDPVKAYLGYVKLPGAPERDELERLCNRLHIYISGGKNFNEAYRRIKADLNREQELSAEGKQDYQYLQGWSRETARRAYDRWQKNMT